MRAQRRAAIAAAVKHFEIAGGKAVRGMCEVIGDTERGSVVRVSFGNTRPPNRIWYVVGPSGTVTAELSWTEAEQLGERPWR